MHIFIMVKQDMFHESQRTSGFSRWIGLHGVTAYKLQKSFINVSCMSVRLLRHIQNVLYGQTLITTFFLSRSCIPEWKYANGMVYSGMH